MTKEEYEAEVAKIEAMSHEDMVRAHRFAPSGCPYFDKHEPIAKVFAERLVSLGGFTPEVSKKVGWEKP